MVFAYFIYKTIFEIDYDNNNSYNNICLYETNIKNFDNMKDKISLFKLDSITNYILLYYCLTRKCKLK